MSPLFTASKSGHTEVVEFLLSHGADMEIRDNVRRTGYCALAKPYNSKHATQKITYYIHVHVQRRMYTCMFSMY